MKRAAGPVMLVLASLLWISACSSSQLPPEPVVVGDKAASAAQTWLKISLVEQKWQLHRVYFAPSTLKPSSLLLRIRTPRGVETLPVESAVVGGYADSIEGPFYVHVGKRQLLAATLLSKQSPGAAPVPWAQWHAEQVR